MASAFDTVWVSSHSSLQSGQAPPETAAAARDRFNQCASAYRQIRGEDPLTVTDFPTLTAGGLNSVRCGASGFYECWSIALITISLPLVVVGSRLGDWVIQRVHAQMFSGLTLLSAVGLPVK